MDLEEVVGLSVERDARSRLEVDLRGTVGVVGDRRLDGLGVVDRQRGTARREATSGVEVNRALVRVGRVGCESVQGGGRESDTGASRNGSAVRSNAPQSPILSHASISLCVHSAPSAAKATATEPVVAGGCGCVSVSGRIAWISKRGSRMRPSSRRIVDRSPVIEQIYRPSGRMAAPVALSEREISANGTVEFSKWLARNLRRTYRKSGRDERSSS